MVFHDILPTLPLPADVIKPQVCYRGIICCPACINILQKTCFQLGNDLEKGTQRGVTFMLYMVSSGNLGNSKLIHDN